MLIQIVVALIIGIIAGCITGLIPGIHINLIGVILVSLTASLFISISPVYLVVFITAMAITHTFIDFIPSIFLGCPDTDTELSILPGHELLKQGKGYEAVLLTLKGSCAAVGNLAAIGIIAILALFFILGTNFFQLTPPFPTVTKIFEIIKVLTPGLLVLVSFFLISLEKKRFSALIVFLLTGILGLSVLNLPSIKEPLLPLLTGLFGGSMLIMSIKNKIQIPKQTLVKPKLTKKKISKPLLGALIASPLCSFLPGLGSGQAAIIGNTISQTDKKGFLVLLGATNTLVMGFSFIFLFLISKTRTGAAAAIQEIIGILSGKLLILILAIVIISGIISFFLTKVLAKFFSQKIAKINYITLSIITLGILIIVISIVSKFTGLLVLAASIFTGIYCISLGVRRTNMMGCLLIPTLLFYLFGL